MTDIFFIEYVTDRSDNPRYPDEVAQVEEQYGYFTDKADAEECLASIVEHERGSYDRDNARIVAENAKKQAEYDAAMRRWKILSDAGEQTEQPRAPHIQSVSTFDEWLDRQDYSYRIASLKPGAAKEEQS